MKKKIILSILAILGLVSCTGIKETSSINNEVKDWTSAQKKIMSDHLYGVTLPYIDLSEETVVQFVSRYKEVQILGPESVSVNQDILKDYASLLSSNGWIDASYQYNGELPEYRFAYQKSVQTEVGEAYVDVQFYAYDEASKKDATEGSFVLAAIGDHVFYDFPSDMFDAETKYRGSNITVPSFQADFYDVLEPENIDVYCFTEDSDSETKYKDILLKTNNYTPVNGKINGKNYAISKDNKFAVGFMYHEISKALEIFVDDIPTLPSSPSSQWPKEGLSQAFNKYQATPFDVPSFEFDGAEYLGYEDEYNEGYLQEGVKEMVTYIIEVHNATLESFNGYLNTLKDSSWVDDEQEGVEAIDEETSVFKSFTKEIESKIAMIDIEFDSTSSLVTIYVHLFMIDPLELEGNYA